MHTATKLGSFMALRANGWSLAKISKELNVPKSTLWEWDNQNKNEIHLLKHLQLEKLQEKYLPTYEEELTKLRSYLDRLESALESQDFSQMGPEYVLQMALQLRGRLGKMREQVPLRPVPMNEPLSPLPFTGCVTRQDAHKFREEYFEGESPDDQPVNESVGRGVPADPPPNVAASHKSADNSEVGRTGPVSRPSFGVPPSGGPPPSKNSAPSESSATDNRPLTTDNGPRITDDAQTPSVPSVASVLNNPVVENTNRTFPDETPPGVKNRPLYHNDFRHRRPNGRPVLPSQNGHANSNGHANGNGHPNGNGNGNGNGHANGNGRLP